MKKVVTICSFISLIFITQSASALSFGEIEVYSKFAEPFNAEIAIPTHNSGEFKNIQVELASKKEFAKRGIARPEILQSFSFQIIQKEDNSRAIHVVSKKSIKELSFRLLVEVSWPKGSIVKAYNVLLTPNAVSEYEQQSIIAQALEENSQITVADALLSLITKKLDNTAIQLLSLDAINDNLLNEWNALTNYSAEEKNLPILQASTRAIQITQEEIESKKLEIESIQEFATELDLRNDTLRRQVLALEEELLLSTKSIFGDSAKIKPTTATSENLGLEGSSAPLESFASIQKQKEMLIAALILLIIALVVYKKKDVIMQKLQVRKNRKADAEAQF